MKGLFNVLELLAEHTGCTYSSYYAHVKTKLYKLFNKYETKFGATRSQRVAHLSAHILVREIRHGKGSLGTVVLLVLVHPPHLHLHLLLVSSQLTWTVTLSHLMRNPLTYFSGGVTTN
jgi:hypothetical protein